MPSSAQIAFTAVPVSIQMSKLSAAQGPANNTILSPPNSTFPAIFTLSLNRSIIRYFSTFFRNNHVTPIADPQPHALHLVHLWPSLLSRRSSSHRSVHRPGKAGQGVMREAADLLLASRG